MSLKRPLGDGLLAAVDLGSNSFHLAVASLDHGVIRVQHSLSEKVQLAAGLDDDKLLSNEAIERGLACLARFQQQLAGIEPQRLRVVATNALRVARNARVFVKQAEQVLAHPIEIIAGREEARLIYVGVSHALAASGQRLVMDIGGGSTECIIGIGHDPLRTESLPMGCVSYSQRFFSDGRLSSLRLERAVAAARLELAPFAKSYRQLGWQSATGSSGTMKAVLQTAQLLGLNDEQGRLTYAGVLALFEHIQTCRTMQDIQFPGLKDDRKPLMPAGISIVRALFEAFKIDALDYADGALREGVLYDLVERNHSDGDVRDRTIVATQQRLGLDQQFAQRVAVTAEQLAQQVRIPLGLNDEDLWLLQRAAQLHEVGLSIAHSGYHRHGAYVLLHGDLPGFAQPEQEALSLLVGGHRRRLRAEQVSDLLAAGGDRLLSLCLLLRLSVLLHHSRSREELPDVVLSCPSPHHWQLRFPKGWLATHPLTRADLAQEVEYYRHLMLNLDTA